MFEKGGLTDWIVGHGLLVSSRINVQKKEREGEEGWEGESWWVRKK
jgi:hypothetical protein